MKYGQALRSFREIMHGSQDVRVGRKDFALHSLRVGGLAAEEVSERAIQGQGVGSMIRASYTP